MKPLFISLVLLCFINCKAQETISRTNFYKMLDSLNKKYGDRWKSAVVKDSTIISVDIAYPPYGFYVDTITVIPPFYKDKNNRVHFSIYNEPYKEETRPYIEGMYWHNDDKK